MKRAIYMVVDEKYTSVAAVTGFYIARCFDEEFHIFIESKNVVNTYGIQHKKLFFHFNVLSNFLPKNLPSNDRWPLIVYYRIFAPFYLSKYDRLLYLDADVAMLGGVDELWNLDLRGQALAAVYDTGMLRKMDPGIDTTMPHWLVNIGIQSLRYFNSGVLLIDVRKWIENDFPTLIEVYFQKFGKFSQMWDQDFLNYIFQAKWIELSPTWNFQIHLSNFGFEKFFKPRLVHFTDGRKPWHWKSFDWGMRYVNFYEKLCISARVDPAELPAPRYERENFSIRRAKYKIRSFLTILGLTSNRSKHIRWLADRSIYIKFFERSLSEKKFADLLCSPIFIVDDVRLVFNGRILVCEYDASDTIKFDMNLGEVVRQD